MKMVGHETESVYRRYAMVDEAMRRDAAVKLAARREQGSRQSGLTITGPVHFLRVSGKAAKRNPVVRDALGPA
jgi:hypothetical protein